MKTLILIYLTLISGVSITFDQTEKGDDIKTVKIKTTAQCGQCKERIEKSLAYEKGVKSSVLDLETKVLTIVYNSKKTTDAKLKSAVAKTGYDADEVKKDVKAYKNLPACCKLLSDPDYRGH
jgi:copper chaperone CopZ